MTELSDLRPFFTGTDTFNGRTFFFMARRIHDGIVRVKVNAKGLSQSIEVNVTNNMLSQQTDEMVDRIKLDCMEKLSGLIDSTLPERCPLNPYELQALIKRLRSPDRRIRICAYESSGTLFTKNDTLILRIRGDLHDGVGIWKTEEVAIEPFKWKNGFSDFLAFTIKQMEDSLTEKANRLKLPKTYVAYPGGPTQPIGKIPLF